MERSSGQYAVLNLDRNVTLAQRISVAGTSALRKQGLLGVEKLEEGSGIWIAPCEAIHTFGMKMPIDVIFLDRDLRVKKAVAGLVPRRISVALSAYSVLEMGSGAIARTCTQVGDLLKFQPL